MKHPATKLFSANRLAGLHVVGLCGLWGEVYNPNGIVADVTLPPNENGIAATALRLMICLTVTQGRRWRANLGLEADAPLGHSIRGTSKLSYAATPLASVSEQVHIFEEMRTSISRDQMLLDKDGARLEFSGVRPPNL